MKFEYISKQKCRIVIDQGVWVDNFYDWCKAQWGAGGRHKFWRYGWDHEKQYFYFAKEEYATLFILRWS